MNNLLEKNVRRKSNTQRLHNDCQDQVARAQEKSDQESRHKDHGTYLSRVCKTGWGRVTGHTRRVALLKTYHISATHEHDLPV